MRLTAQVFFNSSSTRKLFVHHDLSMVKTLPIISSVSKNQYSYLTTSMQTYYVVSFNDIYDIQLQKCKRPKLELLFFEILGYSKLIWDTLSRLRE